MRKTEPTCSLGEFVVHYSLRIFDYRALQYGLLRSMDVPQHKAMTAMSMTESDVVDPENILINVGALREVPDGDDE